MEPHPCQGLSPVTLVSKPGLCIPFHVTLSYTTWAHTLACDLLQFYLLLPTGLYIPVRLHFLSQTFVSNFLLTHIYALQLINTNEKNQSHEDFCCSISHHCSLSSSNGHISEAYRQATNTYEPLSFTPSTSNSLFFFKKNYKEVVETQYFFERGYPI